MKIKALTVRQPWASMIAGLVPGWEKSIETRKWATAYRGPIVICSSAKPAKALPNWPAGQYPTGVTLCVAKLVACRPMTWRDVRNARCELYAGAFAWVLTDFRRIDRRPVKGKLRLFQISEDEIHESIES